MNSLLQVHIKSTDSDIAHQVGELTIVIGGSLSTKWTYILDISESTLEVGEQRVGEDRTSFILSQL